MDQLVRKVVFRVDSGEHIGIGHVMRCLTLGLELKKRNFEVHFITKNHRGFIYQPLVENFFLNILEGGLQKNLHLEQRADYKKWIGGSLEEDLDLTNDYLRSIGSVDLVIVDHYSIDFSYEEKIEAQKIIVIDDLMNRSHACDLLLDQNITAIKDNYIKLAKKSGTLYLMGPRYALLREEFKEFRQQIDQSLFDRPTKNIIVFFGGSDVDGNTLKLAQSLDEETFKKYNFTFILRSEHEDFKALIDIQKNYPQIKVLGFAKNFGSIMSETDLFIGAGGITSWERACLGVASALVAVAENQVGNCIEMQKEKSAFYVGRSGNLTSREWRIFFDKIVPDEVMWYCFRKKSFELVDGLGVTRVIDSIKQVLQC